MKKIINFFLILVVIMNTILLTGCWNYREINNLAIVIGFAIDKNLSNDNYILTAEVVDFETVGAETKTKSKTVESEGETIFDAIRSMLQLTGRRLYWGHAKIVIISEDIAKDGLSKVLDLIYRDPEMRTDVYLVVSKEKTAREIFTQQSVTSELAASEIRGMLESQKVLGEAPITEIYKYIKSISGKMSAGILPTIGLYSNMGKMTSRLEGTAVFKDDKLVCYIDSHETKYLLFAMNQVKRGVIIHEKATNGQQNKLTLEVFNSETKINPKIDSGKLKMKVKLNIEAALAEIKIPEDFNEEGKFDKLEKDAEEALQEEIEGIIKKVQYDYDADIFGFQKYIKADMHAVWDTIEKNWDEVFHSMPVEVEVRMKLRNNALASKPIKVGE